MSCDVTAHGCVRMTGEDLLALRPQLGGMIGRTLPTSLLKHGDEQTIAAVACIGRAIQNSDLGTTDFTNWGVLAAPRFLGRTTMLSAVRRFFAEGAWGVSPHMIPHRSLHAISGTLSQALAIHGPNLGIGGGPGCASEALLAVAAMVGRDPLPGVWAVFTGWDPEPMPGQDEPVGARPVCSAVALALRAADPSWRGLRLRVAPTKTRTNGDCVSVEALCDWLESSPATTGGWRLDCGGAVELTPGVASICCIHAKRLAA
ncbi:MAG: hypothetical protein K2R98_21455 [Gemmataceae bacterium]|nr:hypothetical protein [Gemmataceae bacterium]